MKWLAVCARINVLSFVFQEIEGGITRCGVQPGSLLDISGIRDEDQYSHAAWTDNRQRFVKSQLALLIYEASGFNRVHLSDYRPRWPKNQEAFGIIEYAHRLRAD